jgi:hypothetical protein
MKKPLDITNIFPEISLITDPEIREKTIAVWNRLWEEGNFDEIMDVPVLPQKEYPHVIHNRALVQMSLRVADVLEEFHGVKVDRNFLISAVLLQDACKLVEFLPTPTGYARSVIGKQFQHGFYGAHVALEVGLPNEIIQAILTHTFDNSTYPATLIGKILFYVDQIDMAALQADRWKKNSVLYR